MPTKKDIYNIAKKMSAWKSYELFTSTEYALGDDLSIAITPAIACDPEALWHAWVKDLPSEKKEDAMAKVRVWYEEAMRQEQDELATKGVSLTAHNLKLLREALKWTKISGRAAPPPFTPSYSFTVLDGEIEAMNFDLDYMSVDADEDDVVGTVSLTHKRPSFDAGRWTVISHVNERNEASQEALNQFLHAVVSLPLIFPSPNCEQARAFIRQFQSAPPNCPGVFRA